MSFVLRPLAGAVAADTLEPVPPLGSTSRKRDNATATGGGGG